MSQYDIRTDLALESKEFIEEANGEIRGIKVDEWDEEKVEAHITRVEITSPNGAKIIKKPIGTYITIEADHLIECDETYQKAISEVIARQLLHLLPSIKKDSAVLVVGLGNRDVTADALGPSVVDALQITRHILKNFGEAAYPDKQPLSVSALAPDVMGKTGMETAEIIKGVISVTKPDFIVVIDALAARSTRRLNRTIQLTNTGIHPGSGVGNNTIGLTENLMQVPVIALGIPTVVDATTIISDAMSKQGVIMLEQTALDMRSMYVTSKDIDAIIRQLCQIVADALNYCFTG